MYWRNFPNRGGQKFPAAGNDATHNYKIFAYLSISDNNSAEPMLVVKSWLSPSLDVAVLALIAPPSWADYKLTLPKLSLLPPRTGSEIIAFGYPLGVISSPGDSEASTIGFEARASRGTVKKIHHHHRDNRLMSFPCFQTIARFDPGMSGGPVVDQTNGNICGLVSMSMSQPDDNGDYCSYASTLWPIAGVPVDFTISSPTGGPSRLFIQTFDEIGAIVSDLSYIAAFSAQGGGTFIDAHYSFAEWDSPVSLE